MKDKLPTNKVSSKEDPSTLICRELFTGNEKVRLSLEVQNDIYVVPGKDLDVIGDFFIKSQFADILQKIICNSEISLSGPMLTLRQETDSCKSVEDIRNCLFDNDYSDIISVVSHEAVPGIYSVTAKIIGESTVSDMRKIDAKILDLLNIEVITDFLVIVVDAKRNQV